MLGEAFMKSEKTNWFEPIWKIVADVFLLQQCNYCTISALPEHNHLGCFSSHCSMIKSTRWVAWSHKPSVLEVLRTHRLLRNQQYIYRHLMKKLIYLGFSYVFIYHTDIDRVPAWLKYCKNTFTYRILVNLFFSLMLKWFEYSHQPLLAAATLRK